MITCVWWLVGYSENGEEPKELWIEIMLWIKWEWENFFSIKRRERKKIVEESEVPVGGVPFFAWVFERQRVYSGTLQVRMATEAGLTQCFYHSQWDPQCLDVSISFVLLLPFINLCFCGKSVTLFCPLVYFGCIKMPFFLTFEFSLFSAIMK